MAGQRFASTKRIVLLSGVCVSVGVCCWRSYALYNAYRHKKAAAGLQQGREVAKNMEMLLRELHDGPYSFGPPGHLDDDPNGGDDMDWFYASASSSASSATHSTNSVEEGASSAVSVMDEGEEEEDTHAARASGQAGMVLWEVDGVGSREVSPRMIASDPPRGGADTPGHSTNSPREFSPQPFASVHTAGGRSHKPRKHRSVKAILHSVAAVLSSSEEDEREAVKVEEQQAAMMESSKSFLRWAVGNRPPSAIASRQTTNTTQRGEGGGGGRASPGAYFSDNASLLVSPFTDSIVFPAGSRQASDVVSPNHGAEEHDGGGGVTNRSKALAGAYHTRQLSQVSGLMGATGLYVHSRHAGAEEAGPAPWTTPYMGSLDDHGGDGGTSDAGTARYHRSRRRPLWRRLWRVLRRLCLGTWHHLVSPFLVHPACDAWRGVRRGWVGLRMACGRLVGAVRAWVRSRREPYPPQPTAAATKPPDPVDSFLQPDGAVDVEADLQAILALLKPSSSRPACVPTVAVIRVPIGYEASLETERLLAALHLDSSSREDGLVDLYVIEELKTASLQIASPSPPPPGSVANTTSPTVALRPVNAGGTETLWGRRLSSQGALDTNSASPLEMDAATTRMAPTAASAPMPSPSDERPSRSGAHSPTPPPLPPSAVGGTGLGTTASSRNLTNNGTDADGEDEKHSNERTSRLKLTYEVYRADVFYGFLLRSAIFQIKDDLTREVAARVFGGDPTSATLTDPTITSGALAGTDTCVSAPPTPFVTCVSPMCAPYPLPSPAAPFHGGATNTLSHPPHPPAPQVHPSLSALTPTSPINRGHAGVGGDSPRSPLSARGTRSTSTVFYDATESLQALAGGPPVTLGAGTSAITDFSGSPLRRAGRTADAALTSTPSAAALGSTSQGYSLGPSASHPGFLQPHRPHSRQDQPWGDCSMTVHVRIAPVMGDDGCVSSPVVASPTAANVASFTLPPSVVPPRALQGAARHSVDHTPSSPVVSGVVNVTSPPFPPSANPHVPPSGGEGSPPLPPLGAAATLVLVDEPDVRVRYRTRLIAAGTHSKPVLEKVDALLSRIRKQWREVLVLVMQEAATPIVAGPATHAASTPRSHSLREFFDISPRLRPWSPHTCSPPQLSAQGPALPPVVLGDVNGRSPPLVPRSQRSPLRKAHLPHVNILHTPLLSYTPSLRVQVDSSVSRAFDGQPRAGLKLPIWALNGVLRRESMRETLMTELKARAFRIISIPLPDARVYRQLPPDVPRYIAAHARGFTLAHSFAQEILNQQRHLQRILIGLEQRHLQLQHRREERHRRRHDAWEELHGFFSLDKSGSERHPLDGKPSPQHNQPRSSAGEDVEGEEESPRSASLVPVTDQLPQHEQQEQSASTSHEANRSPTSPTGLDVTRRGPPMQNSSSNSSISLSGYNEEADDDDTAEDGGEVVSRSLRDVAAYPDLAHTAFVTPTAAGLGTPAALNLPNPSFPRTPATPIASTSSPETTSAVVNAATPVTATAAHGLLPPLNEAAGSSSLGSGGKRQGWTTTNTSTNYNVDGRVVSPSASPRCVAVSGSYSRSTGTSPPLFGGTESGSTPNAPSMPLSLRSDSYSPSGGPIGSYVVDTAIGGHPTRTPPSAGNDVAVSKSTPPTRQQLTMDAATTEPSTSGTSPPPGVSWTPLSSVFDDDEMSRRSQQSAPRAPNSSMYGTFDAYYGQSVAAPTAVLMRQQAAGLKRADPSGAAPANRAVAASALQRAGEAPARTGVMRGAGEGGGGSEEALTAPSSYLTMPLSGEAAAGTSRQGETSRAARRPRPGYASAAVMPYNYSGDSVSSMLGTNHYPRYAHTRDPCAQNRPHHNHHHRRTISGANDRFLEYRGALTNLLGSGGGAMSSGITYYYTFGNATASLYNSILRPTPENDPWDRVVPLRKRFSAQTTATGTAMTFSVGTSAEPAGTNSDTGFSGTQSRSKLASTAPASAPPQGSTGMDDGASSYLFLEPDEPDSAEEMVEEQTVLRQSRNQMFYSVYRHLHRVFANTISKDTEDIGFASHGRSRPPPHVGPVVPGMASGGGSGGGGGSSGLPTLPPSLDDETVTLGARTVPTSELDINNGHYGLEPLQVWLATRYSRRFASEVYIMDVAACKSDRHYPAARVLDEVVEHAVLYYHDHRFREFVDDLRVHFDLHYTPQTRWGRFTLGMPLDDDDGTEATHTVEDPEKRDYPATTSDTAGQRSAMMTASLADAPPLSAVARRAVERHRRCGGVCEKGQEEDEGIFFSAFEQSDDPLALENEYGDRFLLRELDHMKEFLLEHYYVLCSSLLTAVGANRLEEVFGVPAMVFSFILCARESVALMDTVYESIEGHYGTMTLENFSQFIRDVFAHDRPNITRHVTRIFRTLDKSRRGYFEYDELCWYMARKLSCGNNLAPDAHLLATAMSLRLPIILIIDQKYRWPDLAFTLASLSDGEMDY